MLHYSEDMWRTKLQHAINPSKAAPLFLKTKVNQLNMTLNISESFKDIIEKICQITMRHSLFMIEKS